MGAQCASYASLPPRAAMRIVVAKPPNYDAIVARFPDVAGKGVLFAWQDLIYNPGGVSIPPQLIVHEAVHGRRQGAAVEGWWDSYLFDDQFRLREEVAAHQAEYWAVCRARSDKAVRARALESISARLCGPLYGGVVTPDDARKLVLGVKRL